VRVNIGTHERRRAFANTSPRGFPCDADREARLSGSCNTLSACCNTFWTVPPIRSQKARQHRAVVMSLPHSYQTGFTSDGLDLRVRL